MSQLSHRAFTTVLPVLTCGLRVAAAAGGVEAPWRPVHTFSIVDCDATTGKLGVAVQSHWFSVGSIVTWAEAGRALVDRIVGGCGDR